MTIISSQEFRNEKICSYLKKFALIFAFALSLSLNAYAKTYHGIDIDKVYSQSDWSSKDKIKEIIDDYSLLLQYNNELKQCSEQANQFDCINNLKDNKIVNYSKASVLYFKVYGNRHTIDDINIK